MKQVGFVKVVLLVLFVLLFNTPVASAQEPLPPDAPVLAEPDIVETTRLERVETADGQTLLVPAFTMELTQDVRSSTRNSPKSTVPHPSGWTMTMWRALWWRKSFGGNYEVQAGGRTRTSVTADVLYVWIEHQARPIGGSWAGIRSNYRNVNHATTTGDAWAGPTMMASGLEHRALAHHQARVGPDRPDNWLIYNNQTGPQRVIP
jgi:hypothetical protein